MNARRVLCGCLLLGSMLAAPSLAQEVGRETPSDSLSGEELVRGWLVELRESPDAARGRMVGLIRALRNHGADRGRAEAVLNELERIALSEEDPKIRSSAVIMMTSGYHMRDEEVRRSNPDTRDLASRLERIYHAYDDERVERAVMSAVGLLGCQGREHALTWLAPLVQSTTEGQSFREAAVEAMRMMASSGAAGRALVIRLRDEGSIVDPEAAFWARFIER